MLHLLPGCAACTVWVGAMDGFGGKWLDMRMRDGRHNEGKCFEGSLISNVLTSGTLVGRVESCECAISTIVAVAGRELEARAFY